MDIVVDTSIIIAVIANESHKQSLIEITQGHTLIAPQSIKWEVGNALSAMFKRKRIGIDDAIRAIQIYEQIPMRIVNIDLDKAIQIVHRLNIYAYDAYLIQCALKFNAPLLTLDRGLRHASQQAQVEIIEINR